MLTRIRLDRRQQQLAAALRDDHERRVPPQAVRMGDLQQRDRCAVLSHDRRTWACNT